jgi:hypothetical protein
MKRGHFLPLVSLCIAFAALAGCAGSDSLAPAINEGTAPPPAIQRRKFFLGVVRVEWNGHVSLRPVPHDPGLESLDGQMAQNGL